MNKALQYVKILKKYYEEMKMGWNKKLKQLARLLIKENKCIIRMIRKLYIHMYFKKNFVVWKGYGAW